MNKENKLGMGLGALLSTTNNNSDSRNGIQKINISQIIPNPSQPRKNFKDEDLKELSSSIKNQGLIQPIIIKPIKDDQYQIIAGERRWRACQLNGMHEVECVIKNLDDTNVLEAALIENIQREDLNVIEEANAYKGLIDIKGINNENLAKLIGKSASHVSNILRLLELDIKIQQMVINGDLSLGTITQFIQYLLYMQWPLLALSWTSSLYQRGVVSWTRVREIMLAKSRITNFPNDNKKIINNCKINFLKSINT